MRKNSLTLTARRFGSVKVGKSSVMERIHGILRGA
jgi:hypothetical protein